MVCELKVGFGKKSAKFDGKFLKLRIARFAVLHTSDLLFLTDSNSRFHNFRS